MQNLEPGSSTVSEWRQLLGEAQQSADCLLNVEVESYLVFTLMRFTCHAGLGHGALATEYLAGAARSASPDRLRDVGDHCLLLAGLYPGRARRRLVRVSYFVDLGRGAYHHLSRVMADGSAQMYEELAGTFVSMMDVLLTVRAMDAGRSCLDPVCAYELWNDTGSRHALQALRADSNVVPLHGSPRFQ